MKITKENFNSVSNSVIDNVKCDIKDKVNAFLSDTGMSCSELGLLLGTTEDEINSILRGESFSVETFAKILVACGFTMIITPIEVGVPMPQPPTEDEPSRTSVKEAPRTNTADVQIIFTNTGSLSKTDYEDLIKETEVLGITAAYFPYESSIPVQIERAKAKGIPFVGVVGEKALPNEEGDRYFLLHNMENGDVKYVRLTDLVDYVLEDTEDEDEDSFDDIDDMLDSLEEELSEELDTTPEVESPSQSPFASMSRERLIEIIENKVWDDEIDVEESTTQELVAFLEEKDRRIQHIKKIRGNNTVFGVETDAKDKNELIDRFMKKVSEDEELMGGIKRLVGELLKGK